jgi:hypothetical protein
MDDMEDIFGESLGPFLEHLRKTAIRTQIGIFLGNSQSEYFKSLIEGGITEEQAYEIMKPTLDSFVKGMVEFTKIAIESYDKESKDHGQES